MMMMIYDDASESSLTNFHPSFHQTIKLAFIKHNSGNMTCMQPMWLCTTAIGRSADKVLPNGPEDCLMSTSEMAWKTNHGMAMRHSCSTHIKKWTTSGSLKYGLIRTFPLVQACSILLGFWGSVLQIHWFCILITEPEGHPCGIYMYVHWCIYIVCKYMRMSHMWRLCLCKYISIYLCMNVYMHV